MRLLAYSRISIHAPPRGATQLHERLRFDPADFNSRPSARGDAASPQSGSISALFQFTPLREGRQALAKISEQIDSISIHAPPRGATESALTSGENAEFQFTPLREGRRWRLWRRLAGSAISIHAPPRGATLLHAFLYTPNCNFNSRPSARGDVSSSVTVMLVILFQFTPLREGRRFRAWLTCPICYFNSRPSARGD